MTRTLGTILLLCALSLPAGAQDQVLIGENTTHGGFGGPVMRFSRIAGRDAFMMGGRGGFVIDGRFVIGGGGYGWSSDHVRARHGQSGIHELEFGYGGLELEYIFRTREVVHWSAQVMIGGGGASQDRDSFSGVRDDGFFILEPGVNLEVNVTRGFRFGAGVAFRHVNGIDLPGFNDGDLRGFSGVLTFKFGKF
jgi:hypothetical protein